VFFELMSLLPGRTVLITVAKVDDKTIRVNVIPTQAKADENPALSIPLTFTGSPEELSYSLISSNYTPAWMHRPWVPQS